ncbi:MAG: helix-turn-helix transcriptional regulator [Clostridia bacterium]|nr:helix-turn-helix transcriptional regulator [Clostridia bacterium]
MLSVSYFSYPDNEMYHLNRCNRISQDMPFVINCAGITATNEEYITHNERSRDDWYLLYVTAGTLWVRRHGTDYGYTSGTFIFFPPGCKYYYYHKPGDVIECFWIHYSGSDAEKAIKQYEFKVFPDINSINHDNAINSRYNNIFSTFVRNDKFRDRELSILFDRLLLSLAKRSVSVQKAKSLLSKSISFINENYNTDIYVPDLADMENLSLSRYNTLFRQITGMSPSNYIKQLRLNTACELLTSTDLAINVIGKSVGYPNQYFFSKMFRDNIGLTPTEYRQKR